MPPSPRSRPRTLPSRAKRAALSLLLAPFAVATCSQTPPTPAACPSTDAAAPDDASTHPSDSGPPATPLDSGDTGTNATDALPPPDSSPDATPLDAGPAPLGIDPPMGWSSWSFVRQGPSESVILAQAQALHDSGLSAHGYIYVNIDDFYYLNPSTDVDANGRWVIDSTKFPHGMAPVAAAVHALGLEFGMYLTPGIPAAAVTKNTPIEGTTYHAADIAVAGTSENNYNFGANVMRDVDFSKPGAQAFFDSWARLLASYGVDYIKLDGVGSFDLPDVQAWSQALKSSGRAIHFELSNSLDINFAASWAFLSNGWRIDGDVECYCGTGSYPLTSWNNVSRRFADAPAWQAFSAPGARNDLDSIEIGNGDDDGMTPTERQTQMSLWALAASPLLLGVDLTKLDASDLALLTNDEVIAVDQAGVAAKQLTTGDTQVWSAAEADGSFVVGLFNLSGAQASVTVDWTALGITGSAKVRDLWARADLSATSGSFTTSVASHGVTLVRIRP